MKRIFSVWLGTLLMGLIANRSTCGANALEPIRLWPGTAPGDTGDIGEEKDTTKPDGRLVAGKAVIRISNVSQPTVTIYRPPKEKDTGAAVIVCPGGGFSILAIDLEGTEVCEWLNSIGVTGCLLKYRVPARKGLERHTVGVQDGQRALGLIRHRARELNLDPKRIGIMGFSAGAHVSAAVSCGFEKRTYEPVDEADHVSCRPDFAMLIYPGLLAPKEQPNRLLPHLTVTSNTPPTLLVQTEDDQVRVENSLFYYLALKNAKVSAEMHLYAAGGHGYGLRPTELAVTTWPKRAEEWLRGLDVLGRGR